MNKDQGITYWAKVNHADEYLDTRIYGDDLTELEDKIEAEAWTKVELIKQSNRTSLVKILQGDKKGLHEVICNQFIISEQ